ncbi:unnamed protein product, partial [Timema podura]|nr:unnamed protein product [Timema podura]
MSKGDRTAFSNAVALKLWNPIMARLQPVTPACRSSCRKTYCGGYKVRTAPQKCGAMLSRRFVRASAVRCAADSRSHLHLKTWIALHRKNVVRSYRQRQGTREVGDIKEGTEPTPARWDRGRRRRTKERRCAHNGSFFGANTISHNVPYNSVGGGDDCSNVVCCGSGRLAEQVLVYTVTNAISVFTKQASHTYRRRSSSRITYRSPLGGEGVKRLTLELILLLPKSQTWRVIDSEGCSVRKSYKLTLPGRVSGGEAGSFTVYSTTSSLTFSQGRGMDFEEYRKRGKEMVDYIADYLQDIRNRRVYPDVKPGYLRTLVPENAPVEPENWEEIMGDVERVIMPG